MIIINTKHDYGAGGIADDASHRPSAIRFQRTTPAQNDEVALPCKLDDSCASIPLGDRKTDIDPTRHTPDSTEPHEKFLRPRGPLMLGLVDVARGDQCSWLDWSFAAWCRNMQDDELCRCLCRQVRRRTDGRGTRRGAVMRE